MTSTAIETSFEVGEYVADLMAELQSDVSDAGSFTGGDELLAEAIFDLLTSRQFCYLGRTKTAPFREQTVELLRRRIALGEPFRFFYDIGPGYHASLRPDVGGLSFDVGLSELLILSQVDNVCKRIQELYKPGARFWLVIDNICGLRTNDVPIELTVGYCERLRALVAETKLGDVVDLIVESEHFDLEEYDELLARREVEPLSAPSSAAVENVERFLGRRCSVTEAAERIERYRRTGPTTDFLMDRLVRGVHMTQRATGATLGFRPFPGGDSRTQAGKVALTRSSKGRLRPVLLTSRNIAEYECLVLEYPDVLPPSIDHVTFAQMRTTTAASTHN
jgi:hypothetical protein